MEPNQNNNIQPFSISSSSSGNLANDSKKSSKRSILRKEGSQSKNKDKHATFVEPLNQVAFYLPDINNINKNNRISLNTVSEEPSLNSRSGSDLVNHNLSSNRMKINTEQKLNFENNEITNSKNFPQNNNITSYNNLYNINNNKNENNIEVIESKTIIFKNQNTKKPPSRKTLDSDYILQDFLQANDINSQSIHTVQNQAKNILEQKNNIISNPASKVVKIRLSNSGRNSFSNESNLSMNLNNNMINMNNNINNNNMKNINNLNVSNNSNSSEKREQQTIKNTEVNKNMFNINAPNNIYQKINPPNNEINDNKQNNTSNLVGAISNQINMINANNKKKLKFNKRITMGINNEEDLIYINTNNTNNCDNNNNNPINDNQVQNLNNNNMNISNINNINNTNNIQITNDINENNNFANRSKKIPKMNKKRITMGINSFDEPNFFSNDIIQSSPNIVNNNIGLNSNIEQNKNNQMNSKNLYTNSVNEEIAYKEPQISAENKNINYENYEKYLKYNDISKPKSEKKYSNVTHLNFPTDNVIENQSGSQTTKKEQQHQLNQLNEDLLTNIDNNLQKLNQIKINNNIINLNNISLNNINNNNNQKNNLNLDSSPLIDLITDKSFKSKSSQDSTPPVDTRYQLKMGGHEDNFDMEKEINEQINFIEKNLEEKEKNWRAKIINNAERHNEFETEINKNKNEINSLEYKMNEIFNLQNDFTKNKNKYDKLSSKGKKISENMSTNGIEIKDIEHIIYKEMNCLLFTVMIKDKLTYKFLISDNIWYEKNISGDSEVTFIGVVQTEVFSNYFDEETIINKDQTINLAIQNYYNNTIQKVFPNEYEKISIHNLSKKYYLSTQISLCFLHILKMINHISLIDENIEFNTQDLKKYFVKFSYYNIYYAKINFIYEFNIENPFSGNSLNSVEIEKNDYILDNFDEYRNKTLNLIWKYFNPKDIQINYNYFYNLILMMNYFDKADIFKCDINDEYVFNVMQGNIKPKDEEFEKEENNKFDNLELMKQIDIIYGSKFLEQLVINNNEENKNGNNEENVNNKESDDGEIILDLPSSINTDEK